MKILGVSLSQFHNKAGFQLVKSVPRDSVLNKQQFKLYSDLILPREELCDRILAIEFKDEYFLVVKPLLSKNKNNQEIYERQKYIYSLSILVQKADYLDQVKQRLYKNIVSKIAHFFKIIQEQNHIIHYHQRYTPYILSILTSIYQDINQKGTCDLTYLCSHYTFINANYPPNMQKKCVILQSSVPVTVLTEGEINKVESEFGRKLLWYAYEGLYCFKKICRLHPDRNEDIRAFYEKGVERGMVFILDMVNINNVYALTQKTLEFLPEHKSGKYKLLSEISKVVRKNSTDQITNDEVLSLYLQFNRVTPLSKVIQANRKLVARIDLFRFVRMGQIYSILKRIHQKIAYNQLPSHLVVMEQLQRMLNEGEKAKNNVTKQYVEEQAEKMDEQIRKYLGSSMTVDEMMVHLQLDYERLMSLLSGQNRFVLQINDQE